MLGCSFICSFTLFRGQVSGSPKEPRLRGGLSLRGLRGWYKVGLGVLEGRFRVDTEVFTRTG